MNQLLNIYLLSFGCSWNRVKEKAGVLILCKFPFRNQFGSYVVVFVDTFYHKTGGKSFHWRKRLVFSRTAAQTSPCFDLSYKLFQKRMS